jgi:hypothetical protein
MTARLSITSTLIVNKLGYTPLNPTSASSLVLSGALATTAIYSAKVTGDAQNRFTVGADGKTSWGPGNAGQDTNLYRSATGTLKTDSLLVVGGTLTLGSGAVTVSNANGNLLPSGFGSQTAKFFMAAPNGANGNPTFRAIVQSDLPSNIAVTNANNAFTAVQGINLNTGSIGLVYNMNGGEGMMRWLDGQATLGYSTWTPTFEVAVNTGSGGHLLNISVGVDNAGNAPAYTINALKSGPAAIVNRKLLSLQNNSVEKAYITAAGNIVTVGTLTLGSGATVVSNAAGNLLASALTGALPAISGASLTGLTFSQLGGAITAAQQNIATTGALGAVKPDGTTITVDANGVISSAGGGGSSSSSIDGMTLMGGI